MLGEGKDENTSLYMEGVFFKKKRTWKRAWMMNLTLGCHICCLASFFFSK
jgi:hypothetical protein